MKNQAGDMGQRGNQGKSRSRRTYVPRVAQWLRNIRMPLMFLSFLVWLMDISIYVAWGFGLVEKYKGPSYVPRLANVYKLCTVVLKPRNIF
jgi:hypothetical protein